MKNIIMITKVKNEADIIEYFLRYHVNFFDHIIVIDNGSLDGTYEIINALISEGLPIELVNEAYADFDAFRMVNQYTNDYVDRYSANQVVFMDADEFLMTNDGSNPRKILEGLSEDKIHYYNWKTYLYSQDIDLFSFDSFNEYRDETFESFTKIIVPGKMILENDIIIDAGNHACHFASKNRGKLEKEHHNDLKFFHFPIRSVLQYKKQIVLNTIDMISNPMAGNRTGSHWKEMFLKTGCESLNLRDISIHYAFYKGNVVFKGEVAFCFKVKLKYEDLMERNLDVILLKHAELQALKINRLRKCQGEYITEKKKIAIWGTGGFAYNMRQRIPDSCQVQVYVDSDLKKEFSEFEGKVVISPQKLRFVEVDLIIIASEKYELEIRKQIKEMMPFWSTENVWTIEELVLNSYRKIKNMEGF